MGPFRRSGDAPRTPAGPETVPAPPAAGLDEGVAAVAAAPTGPGARAAARRFGPGVIPGLRRRFDVLAEPPPAFAAREPGRFAWATCWPRALLEILHPYREHSLPVLREMAGGGYVPAVVVLCRLAADGVDRRRTLDDLVRRVPDWPGSVVYAVAARLLGLARTDPALGRVLEDLRQAPAFAEALAGARQTTDAWDGPPPDRAEPATDRPHRAPPRRALAAAVTFGAGIWTGVAAFGPTGGWAAVCSGVLAAAITGAVFRVAENGAPNECEAEALTPGA